MLPLLLVVGPNASGKSELAVRLAKRLSGEIISADSRQIYKKLSIGTGKVPGKWRRGIFYYKRVPHHLIDEINPKKTFAVFEFKKRAAEKILEISKRGKLPILAGGTGFWVDAVARGASIPEVPPNPKLRKLLAAKTASRLFSMLKRLDPRRAKTIEAQNPRRLMRAIEIAKALGRVPEKKPSRTPYKTLWIGLAPPREKLAKKIKIRLKTHLKKGLIEEAKKLRREGLSWKRFYELGLEYRFLADLLRKRIAKEEFEERLARAIMQYARRQMAWFRKNPRIRWFPNAEKAYAAAIRLARGSLDPEDIPKRRQSR